MSSIRSVKFNAVMNVALTSTNMLVSIVTIPYITRVLSVDGYGNINFAQSISTWLSAICLVGVPTYGIRECAKVRDNPELLSRVVKELLIIITFFTVGVLSIFALCIFWIPKLRSIAPLMWMFLISTLLLSYGVEWFYQAIEQYDYITIRSIIFKAISLFAIFTIVKKPSDWLLYGAILALVSCGNNIFNIIRLVRITNLSGVNRIDLKRHRKPLMYFAFLSIASSIYLSFDSVLLGFLSNNNQVAFYQLAAKLKGICWQVINAIIGVLIPRLSYYSKKNFEQYKILLNRGFHITFELCLGIFFFLLIYAKPIVILISSEKYMQSVIPVQIIGFVNLVSCLSYFIGLCVLTPLNRESKLAKSNLIAVPISVCMNLVLDGPVGAIGASLALMVSELCVVGFQIYEARDVLSVFLHAKIVIKTIMCHVFSALISLFILYIFRFFFEYLDTANSAIVVILGFFAYSLIWLVFSFLLKNNIIEYIFSFAKKSKSI